MHYDNEHDRLYLITLLTAYKVSECTRTILRRRKNRAFTMSEILKICFPVMNKDGAAALAGGQVPVVDGKPCG